jgi:L-threonate 2-dehydrogenase
MSKVAVIGLGAMGLGMARNLVRNGHQVCGYDIRDEPMRAVVDAGGRRADSAVEAVQGADAVFVMVATGEQVRATVCGPSGIASCLREGATVIVTSTTKEADVQALEAPLADRGIHLIDSPVSGGDFGADAGTLALMVACRKDVLQANLHVLHAVGKTVTHVGERIGAGQSSKAVLQVLVAATFASLSEAVVLGAKAGIPQDAMAEFLSESVVGSPLLRNALAKIGERRFTNSGAWVGLICKDLDVTMELARKLGVPIFTAAAAQQVMQATASMFPKGDIWAAVPFLEIASKEQSAV